LNYELNVDSVLGRLKDFQRWTVDYVFQRMYLDPTPARKFLVADEVGLGKTLVARGIITRALDHLKDKSKRTDIIYVCSNAAIASQNVNRLNVFGHEHLSVATRLTMLPAQLKGLENNRVNFVSFTPGTSFDLQSHGGVRDERVVIYQLLRGNFGLSDTSLLNVLQGKIRDKERWRAHAQAVDKDAYDEDLRSAFISALESDEALRDRLAEACERFQRYREHIPYEDSRLRYDVIRQLRLTLARACVHALEPDLVILDEFQRFKDLLDGDDEAAELAQALFRFPGARVLLLSATPYKMLTLNQEVDDDHYADFFRTLSFLLDEDANELEGLRQTLVDFRKTLYGTGPVRMSDATKSELERRLRSVMVRTERSSITRRQDAMLEERKVDITLSVEDLHQAAFIDSVARTLDAGDVIEYWKSSPYLLNFMKTYELKRSLERHAVEPEAELVEALRNGREHLLRATQFEKYTSVDPGNARLRALMQDTVGAGHWRLLWVPPSLPYMKPAGAYAELAGMTKVLAFSSWNVVPDAIAALCSYEAERQMLAGEPNLADYGELYKTKRALLRFSSDSENRLTGMPVLALMYPSPTLGRLVDPLKIALEGGGPPASESVMRRAEEILRAELDRVMPGWSTGSEGRVDQRWYWAAPAILDARLAPWVRGWIGDPQGWAGLASDPDEDYPTGFSRHVDHFGEVFDGKVELGRPPEDLVTVLAEISLAAPALCAMRALQRIAPFIDPDEPALLRAAATIAEGFRTLFNLPDTMGLLRAESEEAPYWRRVLWHGIEGNIQAMLDEYVHGLSEQLGLAEHASTKAVADIAASISDALSLRTSRLEVDEIRVGRSGGSIHTDRRFRLRSRFAIRFGDIEDDTSGKMARADTVRSAFNSPFRPFVLATTSIGQEGLDFHPYCHSVYHWNLPPNPVDMEQREGRVHRYKGHAVRKNIATQFGLGRLQQHWSGSGDPWQMLFDFAKEGREANATDLVPYWIYEVEGGAKVERRVPVLPFSREEQRLPALKRSLAIYRLVFGQPRQEELLAYLQSRIESVGEDISFPEWRISLTPPPVPVPERSLRAASQTSTISAKPTTLFCVHCGEGVTHMCPGEAGRPEPLYVPGDELMLFYPATRNAEADYECVTVDDAGDDYIHVTGDGVDTILRYLGERLWKSEESQQQCEIASRRTLPGIERRLFCRACLKGEAHSCGHVQAAVVPFSVGQRVIVSYPSSPGIVSGQLDAHIVSVRGPILKAYFRYSDKDDEAVYLAKLETDDYLDLDYNVPCSVSHNLAEN